MGDHNTARLSCRDRVGEIGHIPGDLAALDPLQNILLICQQVPGKIQQNHTLFHLCNGHRIDHAPGGVHQRHMDGDVITLGVDIVLIEHMDH